MATIKPENIGFYAKEVKSVIPKEAFKPAYYKLLYMLTHIVIIGLCIAYIRGSAEIIFMVLASVLAGASLSSLFMYSHEFSHNTIVKHRVLRGVLEIFFWAFNYMPATLWRKLHHANHHINANTYKDPDRRPFKSEKTKVNTFFNYLTYPNKTLKFSFTVGLAMPVYTWKHILSVFYPGDKKPSTVLYKPSYSKEEKIAVAFETLIIIALQITIALFLSALSKYLLFTAVSWYVASSLTISLIMTQHYLNPNYADSSDPLLTTTSIKLPKALDFLVDYHSYHIEHHVIPGINFDYYPILRKELQSKFPDRYHSLPYLKAVKKAFDYEAFIDDPLE